MSGAYNIKPSKVYTYKKENLDLNKLIRNLTLNKNCRPYCIFSDVTWL